jgi:Fic family protein
MIRGEYEDIGRFVWQDGAWPAMRYDLAALAPALARVSQAQGLLLGRLADVGLEQRERAGLQVFTDDVLKTSAIEGEALEPASVRSSVARRLGVDIGALAPSDRHVDGVVDMVLDASMLCHEPLSAQRLWGWHTSLFPTGHGGLHPIRVGQWRNDAGGPMQVVSGALGRQRVHFQAPPAERLDAETANFLAWANADTGQPLLIKAGLAHLWFVTLHPFDDGNGRIARAVGDLFLARADGGSQRYYSLSAQIQRERKAYYRILERTQRGDLDVTPWLAWFLDALQRALAAAQDSLALVLAKARFWQRWATQPFNERQVLMLNRVLDGLDEQLSTSPWARRTACSNDTALRDLQQLQQLGVIEKLPGGGRSTAYRLIT